MIASDPVRLALAVAKLRDDKIADPNLLKFMEWCDLEGERACPATPAAVARFVAAAVNLGVDEVSRIIAAIAAWHDDLGFANPTATKAVNAALEDLAPITRPRSWPKLHEQMFNGLPYVLRLYVVQHDAQRETTVRRAQNAAAQSREEARAARDEADKATKALNAFLEKADAA